MKASQLVKVLQKDGWVFARQGKGSHIIYKHPEKATISIPDYGSQDIAIGTLKRILKEAGIK